MFIEYEQIRARAPWSQFVEALDEMLDRSIIRCTAPVLVALLMSATTSRYGGGWNLAPEASAKEAGSKKLSLLEFGPVYTQMQEAATKGAQGKEVAEEHCAVGSWAQGQMQLRDNPAHATEEQCYSIENVKSQKRHGRRVIDSGTEAGLLISGTGATAVVESADSVKRQSEVYHKETLDDTIERVYVMSNTVWIVCFGYTCWKAGVEEPRYSRRALELYVSQVQRLARVAGMTGDRFRSAIAQTEEIRIAAINDGSVDAVGAAFDQARERMHEIVLDLRVLGVNQPRVALYDATQGGAPSSGVGTAGPGRAAQVTSPKCARPVRVRLPGGMEIKCSPCKYAGTASCEKFSV